MSLAVGLIVSGCASTIRETDSISERMRFASLLIGECDAHLAKWGSISMGGPLAASDGTHFKFELFMDPDVLYNSNRLEGYSSLQHASSFQGRAAISTNSNLVSRNEGDKASQAEEDSVERPGFTPNQRRLIRLTASDSFELGLHRLLSDPSASLPKGYRAVFVVFTVSCQPGWKTSSNYVGLINAQVEYLINGMPPQDDAGFQPTVVAVYPAFDTQELMLDSLHKKLQELSLYITGSIGLVDFEGAAERLRRFASETQTSTGLTVATSYSNGGNHFGFEFRPALRARVDLTGSRSKTHSWNLEAITIPCVALVLLNDSDWRSIRDMSFDEQAEESVFNQILQCLPMHSSSSTENVGTSSREMTVFGGSAYPETVPAQVADRLQFEWELDRSSSQRIWDGRLSVSNFFDATRANSKISAAIALEKNRLLSESRKDNTVTIRFRVSHAWKPLDATTAREDSNHNLVSIEGNIFVQESGAFDQEQSQVASALVRIGHLLRPLEFRASYLGGYGMDQYAEGYEEEATRALIRLDENHRQYLLKRYNAIVARVWHVDPVLSFQDLFDSAGLE